MDIRQRIPKQRKHTRLPGWDYGSPAYYYFTLCVHNRELLLEEPSFRAIVADVWSELPRHFAVTLDAFVTMPNHVHGIVVIDDQPDASRAEARLRRATTEEEPTTTSTNLGQVLNSFKGFSTRGVNQLRQKRGEPVWQKNYWDRIIRDEQHLDRVRSYIIQNPLRWDSDPLNPGSNASLSEDEYFDRLTNENRLILSDTES